MLPFASILSWLDAHSGAVTALATVVLVLITIAYVVVTYLLVREQRLQGQIPEVVYEWADNTKLNADLKLHNVGSGCAAEVTVVRGPGDGVPVHMPLIGERWTLLAGEELIWGIGPEQGKTKLPVGELPLTISYVDNHRTRAYFQVLLIRFEIRDDGRYSIRDLGSVSDDWTKRKLRRLARRSLKVWHRPGFQRRTQTLDLSVLLLDEQVRDALRERLTEEVDQLLVWSRQAEAFRSRL